MSLLKVEDISSGYGKKEVIHNISLELNKSEIATLIGSNGAGKSTLLRTIYGLNDIWGYGKVFFENDDISGVKPEFLLKKGIVYIGQKNNTFDSLSVKDNLKIAGYLYSKSSLNKKLKTVYDMLPLLNKIVHKKPNELSGGQKQMVALAMGLLHEPKLILFDEPSVGLDIKNLNIVYDIIEKLKKQYNISFLIVEHRIKEISRITDRWIGMKLGRKIYDGLSIDEEGLREVFL
jgi:branched-chain amino acid transport system ATP-binding protein